MEIIEENNGIYISLKNLIAKKSIRDRINFTTYKLAKALEVPHSILIRLIHPDPTKRVTNPKIETLSRIVDFFRADGFQLTIDEFISGKIIDVTAQADVAFTVEQSLNVYSLNLAQKEKLMTIQTKLLNGNQNLIAFISDEDIKPMFKKDSIFIVDTKIKPEDDHLIVIKLENHSNILIGKYFLRKNKKVFHSLSHHLQKEIFLTPTTLYSIIGVVVQINAKT